MSRREVVEPHYSASQVTLFRRCPRAWWTKYVSGVRMPETEAQARGKMVHGHLERYLRDGTPIPASKYGRIALSGIDHLPEPGTGEVEEEIWLRGETPLPLLGFVDWMQLNEDPPVILDHKTSSSLLWTLGEEARTWKDWRGNTQHKGPLADDVQMTTYGKHAIDVTGASEVVFRHIYYGTAYEEQFRSKYWSHPVRVVVPAARIVRNWSKIVQTTCEMSRTSALKESEVPQVDKACSAYGGCPYLDRCYPVRSRMSSVDVDIDSLFDNLHDPAPPAESESKTGRLEGVNGPEAPPNLDNLERSAPSGKEPEPPKTGGRRVRHPETNELITREERDQDFEKKGDAWVRRGGVSAAPKPDRETAATPRRNPATGPRLKRIFVGCAPVKWDGDLVVAPLHDIVEPYVREVMAQHDVFDLGLIEMGKGYDLVTAKLRENGWPADIDGIIIDKFLKGSERWLAALIPMADDIVRSF